MPKLPAREQRREIYMVAGLLIASLGYSHNLGYWPRGVPATGQSSPSTEGGMVGIHWENFLYSLPVLVVGVLYWLGSRERLSRPGSPSEHMQGDDLISVRLMV